VSCALARRARNAKGVKGSPIIPAGLLQGAPAGFILMFGRGVMTVTAETRRDEYFIS
jgi:hypothetical protein